jgi:iron complex transport system substrate-binding protein
MKRYIAAFVCVVMLFGVLSLTGCSSTGTKDTTETRTITDMAGAEIEVPVQIGKYCVLYSSVLSICAMLDQDLEHMCMCPTIYGGWTSRICPWVEDHVTTVNKKTVTAEQIIEVGTQVVFYSSSTNQETISALQEAGIPCVDVGMKTADDLLSVVDIIAETFGTDYALNIAGSYKEKFAYYQDYVKSCVDNIPSEDRVSVLVIGDLTDITGFGENTYEAYWADVAGLNYILPSSDGADKVNLTMEQVFEFDPDVVAVETFDISVLTDDSAWLDLGAYNAGKVLAVPSALDTWSKPGAESMMIYLWSLNTFYPDYTGELDLTTEVINFYKDFYDYEMSPEYASALIQGQDVKE